MPGGGRQYVSKSVCNIIQYAVSPARRVGARVRLVPIGCNSMGVDDWTRANRVLKAPRASASPIVGLTKPKTLKQKARRFLKWRKRHRQ